LKNTPCNLLEIYQHVGVACYLELEGSTLEPLKMEAVVSSGTRIHSVAAQMRLQIIITFIVFYGMKVIVDLDLIVQVSRSHSGTPHSVVLLWTRDQPNSETST
jgi:hypothetical protein